MVNQWLNNTLSRWLPQACCLCGRDSGQSALCPACRHDLPQFASETVCPQCGRPTPGPTLTACGHCLRLPPAYDRTLTCLAYAQPVSRLISQLKFRGQLQLARLLGELLAQQVRARRNSVQAILPVPLHPRRLRQRGFNQALEIARPVSRICGLPILQTCLQRHRYTEPQSAQAARGRRQNVSGAFRLRQAPTQTSLAIVDDVMTSGHTVNEIASLLRQAGVKHIEVWCVARAWPHSD